MCLATVYNKNEEPECVILEYVSKMEVDGESITLTDVMGQRKVVEGTIKMVDLANGIVRLNCFAF